MRELHVVRVALDNLLQSININDFPFLVKVMFSSATLPKFFHAFILFDFYDLVLGDPHLDLVHVLIMGAPIYLLAAPTLHVLSHIWVLWVYLLVRGPHWRVRKGAMLILAALPFGRMLGVSLLIRVFFLGELIDGAFLLEDHDLLIGFVHVDSLG